MPETDRWLAEFGSRQGQIAHPPTYWLGVPLLILGIVGILWSLPVPVAFTRISPLLNWGTTFLLATVVYYFIISLPLAFGMLPFVVAVAAFNLWLQLSAFSGPLASCGLTLAGVTGIAIGRRHNGGVPAVLHDIQHIMIAPIWVLSRLYHKLGIPV